MIGGGRERSPPGRNHYEEAHGEAPRERDVYISTGTVGRGTFSSSLASRMRGGYPPYSEINKGGIKTVCPTCFLSRDMRMRGGYNLCERSLYFFRTFGKEKEPGKPLPHGIFHGYERHTFRSEATHGGNRFESASGRLEPERKRAAAHQLKRCEMWPGRWQRRTR